MRVIVTGGSGHAGRTTVQELAAAGHEVVDLDAARPPAGLPGAFPQLDLTDAGEVYDAFAQMRPEGVGHLAAKPSPHGFPRNQAGANFAPDHGPFDSVFDCRKVEARLGWTPRYSWRTP